MKNKKLATTLLSTAMVVSMTVPTAVSANEISDTENVIEQSLEQEDSKVIEDSENTNQEEVSLENEEDTSEAKEVSAQAIEQPEVETQSVERAVGTTVYLHPENGSDDKDGATKNNAVRTLNKAMELAGEGGTIYVGARIPVNNGETVTLDRNITFKKYEAFDNLRSLFAVQSGAHLIINNATIDGAADHDKVADTGRVGPNNKLVSCVEVTDASITVNKGAVFTNAWRGIDVHGFQGEATAVINGGEFHHLGEDTSVTQNSCAIEVLTYLAGSKATLTINDVDIHDNFVGSDNVGTVKGAINVSRQMSEGELTVNMNGGSITNNRVRDRAKKTAAAITVSYGAVFNMKNTTITGNTGSYGGAVYVGENGVFNMHSGTISDNKTVDSSSGGAIYTEGETNINGGTLSNNTGHGHGGGAIYAYNSAVSVGDGVQITGNKALDTDSGGGAIALSGTSSLTAGKATISDNSSQYGGGIASWSSGTSTLNGTTVSNNQATTSTNWGNGGGISINNAGTLNVNDATITGNQSLYGGGIGAYNTAKVNINGATSVSENTVSGTGGAGLYGYGNSRFNVGDGVQITKNHATGENSGGGAIAISQTSEFIIGKAMLNGNDAQYGGGIASWSSGTSTLNGTTVSNNQATTSTNWGNGGGISINNSGTINVNDATITKNQSLYGGGIGAYDTAKVNVNGNTFITNNAATTDGGGGILARGSSIINLNKADISGNEAPYGSGVALWNSSKVVMKKDVSITDNVIHSTTGENTGGTVYVSGGENNGSEFIMEDGTIRDNSATDGIHCAGIFVEGYRAKALASIKGGTITNNTNENGDDQSIVVRASEDDSGNIHLGKLELSGTPTITGQVLLRKDTSEDIKVDVVGAFAPVQPVAIDIYNGEWTNHRVIVTYANNVTPNKAMFKPYQDNERRYIAQNKQDLECMNKLQVIFKNDDGTTNKEMYVMPDTKISEADLPTVTRPGYIFKYWKEGKSDKEWDFSQKEITEEVTVFVPEWQRDSQSHAIKYVTNSNASIADVYVKTGSKATKPQISNPKKGLIVEGWYTTDTFKEGTKWNFDDPVKGDMTLYAKWALKKPTGILEAEGNITTVHIGKTVKLIATANHESTGDITYSYQWYKDGKKIDSKTKAVQDTNEIEVDETGSYTVKITASDGTYTSSALEVGPVEVKVTGHTYTGDYKYDENNHWKECDECGEKGEEGSHAYGEWKVIKEATESEKGLAERECVVCGHKQTKEITFNEPIVPKEDKKEEIISNEMVNKTESKAHETTLVKVKTGDQTNIYAYLFVAILTTIIGLLLFILKQGEKK